LEYGRAGGKKAAAETEHRFPDVVALLNKVWAERRQPKPVGARSTAEDDYGPPEDADPRLRRLKGKGTEGA